MKKIYTLVLSVILLFSIKTNSQNYCGSLRYDTEVFTTVDTTNNLTFGSSINVNSSTQILKMNIYEPMGDTASMRPLIIFAHGGSFLGGAKTDGDQVTLCTRFAKRGYVCATIDYRLGMGFPIDSVNATKAVIRAVQDMKAAVRFFRQDAYTSNTYKIDTNFIFAGGTSAGAFMGLHLAYLNQISEVPSWVNISSLGGLEGNSGNPGYLSTVSGVINLCGALGDSSWIVNGDVPVVTMQGNSDQTVPYCKAKIFVLSFPIMIVNGASPLKIRCNNVGVTDPTYTWYNKDHCPFISNAQYMDTTVWFVSNFLYTQLGCTPSNPLPAQNALASCSPTGIFEFAYNSGFEIYPNPSDGNFYVQIENNFSNENEIIILDISGRIVFNKNFTENLFHIETAELPKGIYFVQLITDEHVLLTRKITVQ